MFHFCPSCGTPRPTAEVGANPLVCGKCSFKFFFNTTVAAGVFIFDSLDRVLWIHRAHEPAKGLLAVPGGFVDIGEPLEVALRREVLEEVGLEVTDLRYVLSAVNEYLYAGVLYPVVDCIFAGRVAGDATPQALDGVAALEWRKLENVNESEIAFPSVRAGRRELLVRGGG